MPRTLPGGSEEVRDGRPEPNGRIRDCHVTEAATFGDPAPCAAGGCAATGGAVTGSAVLALDRAVEAPIGTAPPLVATRSACIAAVAELDGIALDASRTTAATGGAATGGVEPAAQNTGAARLVARPRGGGDAFKTAQPIADSSATAASASPAAIAAATINSCVPDQWSLLPATLIPSVSRLRGPADEPPTPKRRRLTRGVRGGANQRRDPPPSFRTPRSSEPPPSPHTALLAPCTRSPPAPCAPPFMAPCAPRPPAPCAPHPLAPCAPPFHLQAPCAPHPQAPCAPHLQAPCAPHPQAPCAPHPQAPCAPHLQAPCAPHPQAPCAPHTPPHPDTAHSDTATSLRISFAEAAAVPAAVRRRFIHHGLAGDVDAIELVGTLTGLTLYDTAPSRPSTWRDR